MPQLALWFKLVPDRKPHGCKICSHQIAPVCLIKHLSVHMCMLLHKTHQQLVVWEGMYSIF